MERADEHTRDKHERDEHPGFSGRWWRFPPMGYALAAGAIAGLTWIAGHLMAVRALEPFGYALAMIVGGRHFFLEGINELREERAVGIEILMSAAAGGAALLGLWDEAAALVFLYATAEALEEYAYARTRSAIRSLLDLAPPQACVLRGTRQEIVPTSAINVGDLIVVRPGGAIATDGIVREGTSAVDESPVTGESMPVEKAPGDRVFAGSINRQGALVVEATATFANNTLSKIIHLVEDAQEQKGRLQRFIERFGRRYSPGVLVAALLLLAIPPAFGQPWLPWALRAVVLLVAAAPCALVMSMPVAAAAGIGIAGRSGVLIKGGVHLENLGRTRIVVFDKTGTLTRGMPEVTDVIPAAGVTAERLLSVAASVERLSEHPLGEAVVRRAEQGQNALASAADFVALTGFGAQARVNGQLAFVGNPALFQEQGIPLGSVRAALEALQEQGKTAVAVGVDHTILGILGIQDGIRPGAREAIDALHQSGIRTAMLTGDNARTATAIARQLGIDHVHAELKPEDKVRFIKRMEAEIGPVAMVGDGINDAPALAAATVGIAMGAAGTDAAIEAADVALMADDLSKVGYAIRLGKAARAISVQNIVFSLLVLSVLIPSALTGALSVVVAVGAHEVSELLAVANGLRVARHRPA